MGRSVLVADDDLVMQKILRVTLECAGYHVTVVCDGEETLRALEAWVPDVVVLDVMMPKLDGFSVLRRIRDDPRTAQVPVVLLTARSSPDDLWRGWQEGVDYYLTKPFDSEELLRFMDRAVCPDVSHHTPAPAPEPAAGALKPVAGPVEPHAEPVNPAEPADASSSTPTPATVTATVLVVDDDPAIQKVLRLNLELEGYAVVSACNGAEALERLADRKPDLVVLDVMMPVVDGLEVLRRIREDVAMADLPVILLTARSTEDDMWQGWQLGADYYMTKPFDIEELLRSMDRLLSGRSPSAGL